MTHEPGFGASRAHKGEPRSCSRCPGPSRGPGGAAAAHKGGRRARGPRRTAPPQDGGREPGRGAAAPAPPPARHCRGCARRHPQRGFRAAAPLLFNEPGAGVAASSGGGGREPQHNSVCTGSVPLGGARAPRPDKGTRHPRALGETGAPPGPGPVPPSPRARRAHLVLPLAAEAEARRPLLVALPVVRPRLVRLKFHHRGGDTPAAPGRRRCRHGSALRVPPRSRDAGAGPLLGSGAGGTPVPAAELLSQQRRAVATAPGAAPRHRGSARRSGPARP